MLLFVTNVTICYQKAMTDHRYILEPYKTPASRYDCPGCGKRKTFSRYLDTETGEHLHPSVGRCNREINCGYHYTPKQYFQDNRHLFAPPQPKQYAKPKQAQTSQQKPVSFIPFDVFEKSRKAYGENNFVIFLYNHFDKFYGEGLEITNRLIENYFIGTSKHWYGANVFWQIAKDGIRTGKIMLYNPDTGKRVKESINWVHSVLKIENFNLQQCFFGEHLLNGNTKPVAIFESEKTAAIASVYFPEMICIACGGLQGLSPGKCKVLQGRTVILYSDLSAQKPGNPSAFELWSEKKKELSRLFPGIRFTISDLLERSATEAEREQGLDLADFLIRHDYRDFQQPEQPEAQLSEPEQPHPKEKARVQGLQPTDETVYALTYADETGLMLLQLSEEEKFDIEKKIPPDKKETFIEIVKSYIDRDFGHLEGWEIIFSNDYSKLKKQIRFN